MSITPISRRFIGKLGKPTGNTSRTPPQFAPATRGAEITKGTLVSINRSVNNPMFPGAAYCTIKIKGGLIPNALLLAPLANTSPGATVIVLAQPPLYYVIGPSTAFDVNPILGGLPAIFNVQDFGADPTGVADSTTAVNAAIAACIAAGGGTVYFPVGVYLIAGQLTIPTTGAVSTISDYPGGLTAINLTVPIRLTGDGSNMMPRGDAPHYGSTLNFTQNSASPAHIETLCQGSVEIDHLNLMDTSSTANWFVASTNPVLKVHDVYFYGSTPFDAVTDCILLGGTGSAPDNTSAGYFQGYGTKIYDNGMSNCRRLVKTQAAANAVSIQDNQIYNTCGSPTGSPVACIELALAVAGTVVSGNVIEMGGGLSGTRGYYSFGVELLSGNGCLFMANSGWDPHGPSTALYHMGATATGNIIIDTHSNEMTGTNKWVYDETGQNTYINSETPWGMQTLAGISVISGYTFPNGDPPPGPGGAYQRQSGIDVVTFSAGAGTITMPEGFPHAGFTAQLTPCWTSSPHTGSNPFQVWFNGFWSSHYPNPPTDEILVVAYANGSPYTGTGTVSWEAIGG